MDRRNLIKGVVAFFAALPFASKANASVDAWKPVAGTDRGIVHQPPKTLWGFATNDGYRKIEIDDWIVDYRKGTTILRSDNKEFSHFVSSEIQTQVGVSSYEVPSSYYFTASVMSSSLLPLIENCFIRDVKYHEDGSVEITIVHRARPSTGITIWNSNKIDYDGFA